MTTPRIPKRLARQVRERAQHRCEYCRTSEWLSGQPCQIDHIVPRSRGGVTEADNLCLACATCNSFKLDRTDAIDPRSGEVVPLFNPRQQNWDEHFAWSDDGTRIVGLTACGRVTVMALKLNRSLLVTARASWVSINRHPPQK
jgi:5-methylcytosine-specific restriction endonuclease McrA